MAVSVGGGEPSAVVTPDLWGGGRMFGFGFRRGGGPALEAEGAADLMAVGLE